MLEFLGQSELLHLGGRLTQKQKLFEDVGVAVVIFSGSLPDKKRAAHPKKNVPKPK